MAEILIAELAQIGFESFTEVDNGLQAYLKEDESLPMVEIEAIAQKYKMIEPLLSFKEVKEEKENWNEIWEKSFEPVRIEKACIVRAPFHPVEPGFEMELLIEPKMSFGTGHHATTYLMLKSLLTLNVKSKCVLDMGCGTSVLAIAASKMGAQSINAIDIEEWAFENSLENIKRNSCTNINVQRGDHDLINRQYDLIMANINKNILLENMQVYSDHLKPGGELLISGFYEDDSAALLDLAQGLHLTLVQKASRDKWCLLHLNKTML